MIRYECLELLAAKITDQLVVTSQSGQRIEWSHLSKHEGNLLVGMMGCAIGVGMGLALALPHRKVIVLDSDGSVLLSLFNLATLGNLRPKNLAIYVFDNGVYSGSRISYPTATAGNTDLAAMAQGAGIKNAQTLVYQKITTEFCVCVTEWTKESIEADSHRLCLGRVYYRRRRSGSCRL